MIYKELDINIAFTMLRGFFKEGIKRKLVALDPDPEKYIRVYVVRAESGFTVITTDRPTIVSNYTDPVYIVDIPVNFRKMPVEDVVSESRVGYIYDTKRFIGSKENIGYIQDQEANPRSSFVIGIICGAILQEQSLK